MYPDSYLSRCLCTNLAPNGNAQHRDQTSRLVLSQGSVKTGTRIQNARDSVY